MNRICPSERTLSEYLTGSIPHNKKDRVEEHLVKCTACREILFDAYIVTNKFDVKHFSGKIFSLFKRNFFLILFLLSLLLSFILPGHFLQLLIVSVITGIKWATDSRTEKMLIMVHKALRADDNNTSSDSLNEHSNKE